MFLSVCPQRTHHHPGRADRDNAIAGTISHNPGVDLVSEKEKWPHEFCRLSGGDPPALAGRESPGGGNRGVQGWGQERSWHHSGPAAAPFVAELGRGVVFQRGNRTGEPLSYQFRLLSDSFSFPVSGG